MSETGWDDMLAEFRALGGTADNIRLGHGPFGRGLFPTDPARPILVRVPDNLLLPASDVRFTDGEFRIAPQAKFGARERAFLESYENRFSWGAGGRADTERVFDEAQVLPAELRARLMSEFHCGDWFKEPNDALVQERFLAARCLGYRGTNIVMPVAELANHGAGTSYNVRDGVAIAGRFSGEILIRYGSFDPHGMFMVWGFATDQPQAFSIAIGGKVGQSPVKICRDLGALAPTAPYWVPQYLKEDGAAKLQFLMIGNRQFPRTCRSIFYKIMREAGLTGYEEAFDMIRHFNRLHFLKLLEIVEGVDGAMALSLRRMVRHQLEAMSYCYGVGAI